MRRKKLAKKTVKRPKKSQCDRVSEAIVALADSAKTDAEKADIISHLIFTASLAFINNEGLEAYRVLQREIAETAKDCFAEGLAQCQA